MRIARGEGGAGLDTQARQIMQGFPVQSRATLSPEHGFWREQETKKSTRCGAIAWGFHKLGIFLHNIVKTQILSQLRALRLALNELGVAKKPCLNAGVLHHNMQGYPSDVWDR